MASYFHVKRSKNDRRTLIATEAITKGLLLAIDASNELEIADATSTNVVGVALETQADGDACAFATGVLEVTLTAGAAITAGETVMVTTGGKVITWVTNTSAVGCIGVAQEAASADGDLIRCFVKLPVFEIGEA